MAELRQKMRGTTAQLDGYIGLEGQFTFDIELHEIRVFDGSTLGGFRVPNLETIDELYAIPERLARDSKVFTDTTQAKESGFYRFADTATDLPIAETSAMIVTHAEAELEGDLTPDEDTTQIWVGAVSNVQYMRARHNGLWSTWKRIVDKPYGDTIYLGIGAKAVDSDLLDGLDSTYFTNIVARLGYTPVNRAGDTIAGSLTVNVNQVIGGTLAVTGAITHNGATVWDSANDGAGSGLDADKLDGQDSTYFGRRFVGELIMVTGNAAPAGTVLANGAALTRASYPDLWAYAQGSGNIAASDGAWTEGQYSPGNGTTTFRIPDVRGRFIRAWDNSRGIDSGRGIGTSQTEMIGPHNHSASTGSAGSHNHSLTINAGGSHAHGGTAASAGAHTHTYSGIITFTGIASGSVYGTGSLTSGSAGAHTHTITTDTEPAHTHTGTSDTVSAHTHTVTVSNNSGTENRPANIAYAFCIVY